MGKLVLFLADGTTLDIRLARSASRSAGAPTTTCACRIRRSAASTPRSSRSSSDSFLEDLGSTNGTLVNGKTDRQALPARPRPDRHRPAEARLRRRRIGAARSRAAVARTARGAALRRARRSREASAERRRPGCGSGRGRPRPRSLRRAGRRGSISIALSRRSLLHRHIPCVAEMRRRMHLRPPALPFPHRSPCAQSLRNRKRRRPRFAC